MARTLLALLTLLGSLLAAAIPVAAAPESVASELSRTIDRLGDAFERSSAADLRALLSTDRKVFLAVAAVNPQRRFLGADQVFYLFQSFFATNRTRRFSHRRVSAPDDGELFLEADWRYAGADGEVATEQLLLLLVNEEGHWRLREIRTAGS